MIEFDPKVLAENLQADRDRLAQIVQSEVAKFLAPRPASRLRIMVRVGHKHYRVRLPATPNDDQPLQQQPTLWKAIFTAFYGRPPRGDNDPDWSKLFDLKVYGAMSYLPGSTAHLHGKDENEDE